MGEALDALEQVLKTTSRPSRRDSFLHPHRRSLDQSEARRTLRGTPRCTDAGRRSPGAHAESHLLSRRSLSRFARSQSTKRSRGMKQYLAQGASARRLSRGLLSAQRAFSAGFGADGRRRQDRDRCGRQAAARGAGRGRTQDPDRAAHQRRVVFRARQFSDPETILALPAPGEGMPMLEGLWHYARGAAYAARGDAANADAEVETLSRMIASSGFQRVRSRGRVPAKKC